MVHINGSKIQSSVCSYTHIHVYDDDDNDDDNDDDDDNDVKDV